MENTYIDIDIDIELVEFNVWGKFKWGDRSPQRRPILPIHKHTLNLPHSGPSSLCRITIPGKHNASE